MKAPAKNVRVATVKTTLYELIEALSDVVESGDETLVNVVVLDLIDSGRMKRSCGLGFSNHTRRAMKPRCGKIDDNLRENGSRHV